MERREDVQNGSVTGLTILVVEDDQGIRRLVERNLVRAGFQTASTATGGDAITKVSGDGDLILLLDYQLPDMTGKQVVEKLSAAGHQVPFVIMTGQGDERTAVEMMKLGARDYVVKDATFMDLLPQVVKRVVREVNAERQLDEAEARLREARRSIFTLLSNLPGMAYRCGSDRDRTMAFVSEGCSSLTGYDPSELAGRDKASFIQLIHPDDQEAVLSEIQSALEQKEPFQIVYRLRGRLGEERWVWEKGTGVFSPEGNLQAVEGFMTDITDRKQAEAEVLDYAKQLETLFNIGVTLSQTLNLQELLNKVLRGVLEAVNTQAGGIFLLEGEDGELVLRAHSGVSPQFVQRVERLKASEGFTQKAVLSGKPLIAENVVRDARLQRLGVKREGIQSLAVVPIAVKETVLGVMGVATYLPRKVPDRDVRLLEAIANQIGMAIENARLYEETVQLAFTDGLTGLYNRRYLLEQLDREFARAKRHGAALSGVMIDLDGLKTINDNFGHREGDAFLCEVAKVIKRSTRASDVAARWGGDEFVVLAPDTGSDDACSLGERIRLEVQQSPLQVDGTPTAISVSVGVASYPTHAVDITELFQRADGAVYEAKRLGKNQVRVASLAVTKGVWNGHTTSQAATPQA